MAPLKGMPSGPQVPCMGTQKEGARKVILLRMKYVSADIWQFLIILALSPCFDGLDVRLCYTAGFLCNIVDWLFVTTGPPAAWAV